MNAELSWLENPEVFRVNRLDAHSDHRFFESEEELQSGVQHLRQSLNGTWRFAWSAKPSDRPADFYRENASLEGFGEIRVPGHMELQGFGRIHYTNTAYPWDGHTFLRPPHIDWDDNPVGSYVREFDLEPALRGKRVCVSFQGAEQAIYVWLNGVFIGYAEDSFTPSEFDLSGAVRETGNRLCVEVYKRSSAAWIEDQDFFRFSGLFRDVYLYAKPDVHIEDLSVKAGLTEDCRTGVLDVEAKVSGGREASLRWELQDAGGETVLAGEMLCEAGAVCGEESKQAAEASAVCKEADGRAAEASAVCKEADGRAAEAGAVCKEADGRAAEAGAVCGEKAGLPVWKSGPQHLADVQKWEPGAPYLYRLLVRVIAPDGTLIEIVPYRVGFRRFEIRDKIMMLNGKRLEIHGVNRHEWNPHAGRAITEADMRTDIEILKRNNINAVRTCHYPDQSLWYELCDEAGICVMDEANLESHGSWQKMGQCEPSWNVPGSRPEWEACVVDRAVSMLERDKNHPSVLWWSCGNESYAGTGILAMSRYFHEEDPSRLVHYEGVCWNREFNEISDVESRMYAPPQAVREYLEHDPQKPFILCEYMHDMGNSIGGMESYMRLFEEYPMYQGGFIWDYIDQAIYMAQPYGRMLGYGGDFGDRPTDYAFSGNGIVFADRTEKPAMQEVRFWYASADERKKLQEETHEQLALAVRRIGEAQRAQEHALAGKTLTVIHGDTTLGVRGADFHFIFSHTEGGPVSIVYDGRECLYRAPRPAFWRASTENDKGNGFAAKSAAWFAADLFSRCVSCTVEEYAGTRIDRMEVSDMAGRRAAADDLERVKLTYTYAAAPVPGMETVVSYTVLADGRILVESEFRGQKGLPQLPLFGLRFVMPAESGEAARHTVVWEGLSGETYPDRMAGGRFGIHEDTVSIPAYLVPQECGNHVQTCRMQTGGLRFEMKDAPFQFSVLPYTPFELENALHREELPTTGRTVVTILARMRGVGGIDSWGADVEPAYHVSAEETIRYAFYIGRAEQ